MNYTLRSGLDIVEKLNPMVNTLGYYIGLTGSLLWAKKSDNDIDLILYPHVGREVSIETICDRIKVLLDATEMFEIKHKEPSHLVIRMNFIDGGIIDLFFLHKKPTINKPTTQYKSSSLHY